MLVERYVTMGGFDFVESIPLMLPKGRQTQELPNCLKDPAAQARYLLAQAAWAEEDFREVLQSVAARVNNVPNMTALRDAAWWEGCLWCMCVYPLAKVREEMGGKGIQ